MSSSRSVQPRSPSTVPPGPPPLGRWHTLLSLFSEVYGRSPTLFVRAPGRVNLIGEHTDYNGLPVLPMALHREVALLLRPRNDTRIRVVNAAPGRGIRDVRIRASAPLGPPGDWGNYLLAPARHLAEQYGTLAGFDAVLDSDVPVAAGLSSSAALVVAVGAALDAVNRLGQDALDLAEEMARAERFVGTQGGGMDQAVCLCARAGYATRIEFYPLRVSHRRVPPGWRFVVAHSLVRAEKSAGAMAEYNRRTRECAQALSAAVPTLGLAEGAGYRDLLEVDEPARLLDGVSGVLDETLLARFRHVVTEGRRVRQAEAALLADDRKRFGVLMDASHASLQDDFEVSTPELDRLVSLAREAGADGARLTGAGFGGCVVALVQEGGQDELIAALEEGYYATRSNLPPRPSRLFVAEPGGGTTVRPV